MQKVIAVTLALMIAAGAATSDDKFEKKEYVDKYPEYIQLGPHPLLSMKYLSGDKQLYVVNHI